MYNVWNMAHWDHRLATEDTKGPRKQKAPALGLAFSVGMTSGCESYIVRAMATKTKRARGPANYRARPGHPQAGPEHAEEQVEKFIDKYSPEVAALMRVCRANMQALVPGAVELVYDNYNALVIGYGPSERASEAPLSIAAYPKWVNLYFLDGVGLPDPKKILRGGGKVVRNVIIKEAADLQRPEVKALIKEALKRTFPRIDPKQERRVAIRAVAVKQRARR